jgi:DNA-binding transcriptional LysR family regulator
MPLSRARVLPAAVAAFHAQYPDVRIAITEGAFGELIEPLRDGDLDLIVGAVRDPAPGDDVEQEPLFFDHPAIIGRKNHPLANSLPTMAELANFPWVIPPQGTPLYGQWRAMFEHANICLPVVPIECGSVIVIRQLLLSSDFLTMLSPDQVAVELMGELLYKIADAPAWLTRKIGMTTRTGWRPTPMQAAFIEQLRMASSNRQ